MSNPLVKSLPFATNLASLRLSHILSSAERHERAGPSSSSLPSRSFLHLSSAFIFLPSYSFLLIPSCICLPRSQYPLHSFLPSFIFLPTYFFLLHSISFLPSFIVLPSYSLLRITSFPPLYHFQGRVHILSFKFPPSLLLPFISREGFIVLPSYSQGRRVPSLCTG